MVGNFSPTNDSNLNKKKKKTYQMKWQTDKRYLLKRSWRRNYAKIWTENRIEGKRTKSFHSTSKPKWHFIQSNSIYLCLISFALSFSSALIKMIAFHNKISSEFALSTTVQAWSQVDISKLDIDLLKSYKQLFCLHNWTKRTRKKLS